MFKTSQLIPMSHPILNFVSVLYGRLRGHFTWDLYFRYWMTQRSYLEVLKNSWTVPLIKEKIIPQCLSKIIYWTKHVKEASKKSSFLLDSPKRPLATPPPGLVVKKRQQLKKKSLVDNSLPPPLIVDCPLKKNFFMTAFLLKQGRIVYRSGNLCN